MLKRSKPLSRAHYRLLRLRGPEFSCSISCDISPIRGRFHAMFPITYDNKGLSKHSKPYAQTHSQPQIIGDDVRQKL